MDCGPTCLRMVAKYHGQSYSVQELRERTQIGKDGVNLLGISDAAESIGFRTIAVKVSLDKLLQEAPFPCIVHWSQNHFVVITPSSPNKGGRFSPLSLRGSNRRAERGRGIGVADPARGLITYTRDEFEKQWATTISNGQKMGVALLLEPTPELGNQNGVEQNIPLPLEDGSPTRKGLGVNRLGSYLYQNRRLVGQLGVGLLVASLLQLIFPFLTQSVVDVGIQTRNPSFILLVLLAQLALTLGRTSVEFIRSWLLMHLSTRLNLSLLSYFLIKLTRLPLSFFDTKQFGDIMQRISDHHRIEQFLTGQTLNTLFSLFNLVIFGAVLAFYNLTIFGVLMLSALLYAGWVMLFLKFRRKLDYQRFGVSAKSNSTLVQLIQGMHEIRLAGAETPMLRQRPDVSVGTIANPIVQTRYERLGCIAVAAGRGIAHQRRQKHFYHVFISASGYQRSAYLGRNVGRAVHHRSSQCSASTTYWIGSVGTGRQNQFGAIERNL